MTHCTNHTRRQKRIPADSLVHLRHAARIALQLAIYNGIRSGRPQVPQHPHPNSNPLVYLPRVDILDDPNFPRMVAVFELPGVRRDQISVTITRGIMHVCGRRVSRTLQEHCSGAAVDTEPPSSGNGVSQGPVRYPVQELRYGQFGRGVKLPEGITESDLTTSFNDGLFTVTWPRQAKASDVIPPGEGQEAGDHK